MRNQSHRVVVRNRGLPVIAKWNNGSVPTADTHQSTATVLAGKFHVGMADTVMPCQCICAAERLLLGTQVAPDLLLAAIVNRVLVPCEVVRSGEDSVARLASARVDAATLVGPVLRVHQLRRHAITSTNRHDLHLRPSTAVAEAVCLTVTLTLVLL